MAEAHRKAQLAIVSPFLEKSHGTERIIVEWITQLAGEFEIHIYSQSVKDVDLSSIVWHRIPALPGPHLLNFLWWFAANHLWRFWDRRFRGLGPDIVFSPGVNCFDADAVSVHIVFAEFLRRVRPELALARNPIWFWPRLIHRRLYYRLILWLEGRVYRNPETLLILIARKTKADLERFYGRRDRYTVIYLGLDHATYRPERRAALRQSARKALDLSDDRLALLLVGNDWHKKGIRALFEAMALVRDLPVELLIVGRDDPAPFRAMAESKGVGARVHFLPPRNDVEFYYAAADIYAGPSLEDTFALPPAEAMACGLPVIVSAENGTFEIITDGADGLILQDPNDARTLAAMIRRLCENAELRRRLGRNATETVRRLTWERNGRDLAALFEEILRRKVRAGTPALTEQT